MLDALSRRSRFSSPRPDPERRAIVVGERDLTVFEVLDRHGPLPSTYLFEFVRSGFPGCTSFKNRLTTLYNGFRSAAHDRSAARVAVTFLRRDPRQWETLYARYQPAVYALAPRAKLLIEEAGRGTRFSRPPSPFVHDLFASCVTASVELASGAFISRDRILLHEKCPPATRTTPFHIPLGAAETLIPDDLFGIEYAQGRYRFYALEVDRATERITGAVSSSIARKVTLYQRLFDSRAYRSYYGLPNLTVVFATTSVGRAHAMLDYVHETVPDRMHDRFLFKAFAGFGHPWRVPRDLLPVLDAWQSARGERRLDVQSVE